MKEWMMAVALVGVAPPADAIAPCMGEFRAANRVAGPTQWNGRTDIPTNWVFEQNGVAFVDGSWWARRLPDGPLTRLDVTVSDEGLLRIAPFLPFDVGGDYEVVSSETPYPDDVETVDALFDVLSRGTFTTSAPLERPPPAPILLRTSSESALTFVGGGVCNRLRGTVLKFIVQQHPEHASLTLRHRRTGEFAMTVFPSPQANGVLLFAGSEQENRQEYEVIATSLAGFQSVLIVSGDPAASPIGCATSTGSERPLLSVLLLCGVLATLMRRRDFLLALDRGRR